MIIECYVASGCASESPLRDHIKKALELKPVEAEVSFHRIGEEEAENLGLRGSPSVLINGRDILPGEIPGFS